VARLESTARAGYYPTPPRVTAAIARLLPAEPAGGRRIVRLLDPCAGTGEAALTLARALGAESFGIELNEARAMAARERLDHILATSAFSVRLANGAFSYLYLNPPYSDDEERRRLEHAFLTSLTRALCPGGVLIFVVLQRRLGVSARYLASHYTGFAAYRFPDPEYSAFGQMVLFAARKSQAAPEPAVQAQLETWSRTELAPLPDDPAAPLPLRTPSLPAGEVVFASLFFDPAAAAAEAQRRGVWAKPQLAEQLWPPEEIKVRPLMPLRRGHLALLIAAGMLNNVVLEQDGRRVLVKGRAYKELVAVETEDEDARIEREVLRTSIKVFDLANGAIESVDPTLSGEAPAERAA
jgi:predicted RNA methylase